MSSPKNYAAFLTSNGARLTIGEASIPDLIEGCIVIKTAALAMNPIDYVMQDTGFFIQENNYPFILGCDVAGTVHASASPQFKVGDRVMAHANGIFTQDPFDGGFQHYVRVSAELSSIVPDTIEFKDAVVLPLSITTAASGLYSKDIFGLPFPTIDAKPTGKTLLVWGGSSSIGSTTIQLAVASGLRVITTASPRNKEYCKSLGASEVFDHTDKDIVQQLVKAVNSSNKDFVGVYDAIDHPESQKPILEFLQSIGGGLVAHVLQGPSSVPDGITTKAIAAPSQAPKEKYVSRAVWGEFVPKALQEGVLKPAPPAHVAGKGLEAVQSAVDLLKKGVSGQKVVVEI